MHVIKSLNSFKTSQSQVNSSLSKSESSLKFFTQVTVKFTVI